MKKKIEFLSWIGIPIGKSTDVTYYFSNEYFCTLEWPKKNLWGFRATVFVLSVCVYSFIFTDFIIARSQDLSVQHQYCYNL